MKCRTERFPWCVRSELREAVMRLAGDGVDMFYVGDNGRFDAQVRSVLSELGL